LKGFRCSEGRPSDGISVAISKVLQGTNINCVINLHKDLFFQITDKVWQLISVSSTPLAHALRSDTLLHPLEIGLDPHDPKLEDESDAVGLTMWLIVSIRICAIVLLFCIKCLHGFSRRIGTSAQRCTTISNVPT
jgi:hypothetical protein